MTMEAIKLDDVDKNPSQVIAEGVDVSGAVNAKQEFLKKLEKSSKSHRKDVQVAEHQIQRDKFLVKSLKSYKRGDHKNAALRALDAANVDEGCSQAYHLLALALEGLGQLHKALQCYERALGLDPHDPDLYVNLGLVAWKLGMLEGAEKFFRICIAMRPDSASAYNNLGGVLRDKGENDEAVEVLRGAIYTMPNAAELWNSLGSVVMEQGQVNEALTFYGEALRLSPKYARVYHNKGYALNHTGPLDEALKNYDKALKLTSSPKDEIEIRHSRALCLLGMGRLDEGWNEWEARHNPQFRGSMLYAIDTPRWQGEDLAGKRLLIVGEQGLGDELMFATGYRELIDQIGANGQLIITCDTRLSSLFERSFPGALIGPYQNSRHNGKGVRVVPWLNTVDPIDYFSPCGSTLRFVRNDIDAFPTEEPTLRADPDRIDVWRDRLADMNDKPKVGICWRSLVMSARRAKYFSPMEHWGPVLKNKDVQFVNLQYGECADDIADAKRLFDVDIHDFEDLDLKDALDENAALCGALDLVISAPTAAGALAGAVGTEVWLLAIGDVWPMLGTDRFPWFPNNHVIMPDTYSDWENLMAKVGDELAEFCSKGTSS
jgi:tetratricopeptide (TPR) repeat protein